MIDPRVHLLHLASPALPVGAYAYSQGLEYAIEADWVRDDGLKTWLRDGLQLGVGHLDLPILRRAVSAFEARDNDALETWNLRLLAHRETAELLLEDQQIGRALWRLLRSLHDKPLPELSQDPGYAVAFAVACGLWNIGPREACEAFCYAWLENQVTAATKLVPLGQTAAQRLLLELMREIHSVCAAAETVADEYIGMSLPGLALASCRHEHQHTRLFRS